MTQTIIVYAVYVTDMKNLDRRRDEFKTYEEAYRYYGHMARKYAISNDSRTNWDLQGGEPNLSCSGGAFGYTVHLISEFKVVKKESQNELLNEKRYTIIEDLKFMWEESPSYLRIHYVVILGLAIGVACRIIVHILEN